MSAALSEVLESMGPAGPTEGLAPLYDVDPQMAFSEFSTNGQTGLDAMLAALDSGHQVPPLPLIFSPLTR